MANKLIFKSKKDFSNLKQQNRHRASKYLLLKEYEIVQSKIDNYGSSDISYKTLTITLTAAALFASKSDYFGDNVLIVTCLIIFYILFSEGKNNIYEMRLANRAQALEKALNKDGKIKHFPGIVNTIINQEVLFGDVVVHIIFYCYRFIFYYGIVGFLLFHYIIAVRAV